MRLRRVVLPCLLALTGVLASAASAGAAEFVPGELIVRFKPGVSGSERADARRERGATVERALPVAGAQVLDLPSGQAVRHAAASFEDDPRVLYAEPNYVVRARDLTTAVDDPFAGQLWGLDNEAQFGGLADADIDALEGWGAQAASPGVKVAVVDSGVDLLHPDLRLQLENGWDYVGDGVNDDAVPQDLDGHGTHVAGTIGAHGNDAIGVSGVSQDVRIVPIRVLDAFGDGTLADVEAGFQRAADEGASIVNASLGGSGSFPESLRDVIAANEHVLFVVAAGNGDAGGNPLNNDAVPDWPCNYVPPAGKADNVICVAASSTNDAPASFSNYGPQNVDIAAPGVRTVSSSPQVVTHTDHFTAGIGAWQGESLAGASAWESSPGAAGPDGTAGIAIAPSARYLDSSDTVLRTSTPIDLQGERSCGVLFDLRLGVDDDGGDVFTVQAATDPNGVWTTVFNRASDTTGFQSFFQLLPAAFDGQLTYLRVRFQSDALDASADARPGPEFDWLEVTCPRWEEMSGTSMATPHVSGAAALALAQTPTLTSTQLKARLLSTGDPSACWTGITATGARLNVARALGVASGLGSGPTASSCPVTVAQQEALKQDDADPPPAPPAPPAPPPAAPQPPAGTDSGATPTPMDDDPPVVTTTAARRYRASTLLRRGLRARIRCDEECRLRADVLVGRRTAKRLGIRGRRFGRSYILVGRSRTGLSRAGSKTVITRISRRAYRGLRRGRNVRLVLRVLARDEAGNDRVTRRSLTVR